MHPPYFRYNEEVPPGSGARITPIAAGTPNPTVVLVGNSKAIWHTFLASCARGKYLAHPHPLEHYIETCILSSVAQHASGHRCRVYWSHSIAPDLEGGPGYVAMQRMAVAAGIAYLDEVSHLCMHPTYGAWFSLRAALVFDDMPWSPALRKPVALPSPLDSSARQRVEQAVAAAMQARDDASAEKPSMHDVRAGWRVWLAVREAAFPGHRYRYDDAQILYHYTGDRRLLADLVATGR
jgi:hypothetical protein